MKQAFTLLFTLLSLIASAQFNGNVIDAVPSDSAVVSFDPSIPSRSSSAIQLSFDTANASLWRIGTTSKHFFAVAGTGASGIMTDTANDYPASANDWFTIKVNGHFLNPIISFTHKFETRTGMDGGVVEYSFDSLTWNNVVGGCYSQVLTDSFYKAGDTLQNGTPTFSGTTYWKRSRFQLFQGIPIKMTGSCQMKWPFFVRFRFVSDTTTDSLAGWIIRNIIVEKDYYGSSVNGLVGLQPLHVYPNPSRDGLFYWPEIQESSPGKIEITDPLGRIVLVAPYQHTLDCSKLSSGLYYYHVRFGEKEFAGKLFRE